MMPTSENPELMAAEVLEEAAGWAYLHDLFRKPSPEQWEWLRSEPAQAAWRILAGQANMNDCPLLPVPGAYEVYVTEFISTFEVGVPHPPCPLIESHWNKRAPVPKVLHENMLFYKQFGLELRSSANETADHLRHQLEFMHYLCRKEFEALTAGQFENAGQIARATSEYVARHLACWLPKAFSHLRDECPGLWCTHWMRLLSGMCQQMYTQGGN